MKPIDWIAMSVIGSSTFLIYSGIDGIVGWSMMSVVAFYFGNHIWKNYGSRNDDGLLHKETGKR